MSDGRFVKPIAMIIVLVTVLLAALAVLALLAGPGVESPAGASIQGQSPAQFHPETVEPDVDPESGEITIEGGEGGRILVDNRHDNRVSEEDLSPIVDAAFAAGTEVDFAEQDGTSYHARLSRYDGLLIVEPARSFSPAEIKAVRNFTDDGGHVVVLAEPTRIQSGGGGIFTTGPTSISFGANNLTEAYGVRMGAEQLYNVDEAGNDNNFMSVYSTPVGDGPLTEGAETIQIDTGGYAVIHAGSDAVPVFVAVDGTKTLASRRSGEYPVVVRSGNFVFVADASIIDESELYDVDNEAFVGNLLEFLVEGDSTG